MFGIPLGNVTREDFALKRSVIRAERYGHYIYGALGVYLFHIKNNFVILSDLENKRERKEKQKTSCGFIMMNRA